MGWEVLEFTFSSELSETEVSYPRGSTESVGTCVAFGRLRRDDGTEFAALALDKTAAHPVSSTWPDQPADPGAVTTPDGTRHGLVTVIQGAIQRGDSGPAIHPGVPAGRIDRGQAFDVVLHLVDASARPAIGEQFRVAVDVDYRRSVSLAHSACHLNSLALNIAVRQFWNKPVQPADSLGNPNFDQLAIESSTILPYQSIDVYRLGKSLRKKGFDSARLTTGLREARSRSRRQLESWLAAAAPIGITAGDGLLTSRREWSTELDGIAVAIPCGGTHIRSTAELTGTVVDWVVSPELDYLTVTTTVPQPTTNNLARSGVSNSSEKHQ